jgi:hypothetical protein
MRSKVEEKFPMITKIATIPDGRTDKRIDVKESCE